MKQPFDGYVQLPVLQSENGRLTKQTDAVARETAVALSFNGVAHAVMLATPLDLADFAVGFSLSEGIIDRAEQIFDIEVIERDNGMELAIEIASEQFLALKSRRRTLMGTTGCGLCGQESLDAFSLSLASVKTGPQTAAKPNQPEVIPLACIAGALAQLPEHQVIFNKTGSVHAAAWVCLQGGLRLVREDVGRHNALDKLIGAMAAGDIAADTGFILCTSRASYEMAFKAQRAGVLALVCVSAPTSKAIEIAEHCGLGLAGFARGTKIKIYANATRFGFDAE